MSDVLLELSAIRKTFDATARHGHHRSDVFAAVDGVDLVLRRGRTFALVGESGSGKSTLGLIAAGLIAPTSGVVRFDGELGGRGRAGPDAGRIQMVYQDPSASFNPMWRVGEIVGEPLRRLDLGHYAKRDRIAEVLEQVGLSAGDIVRSPREFSGGQRQRIAIARAIAGWPDLLICDEPTSSLDVSVQAQILNLLLSLQRRFDLTCLFISHDVAAVSYVADEVGFMRRGKLVEQGEAGKVLADPQNAYSAALIRAAQALSV